MYAFTDFIVWLWLFPVTLFIILPLNLLAAWAIGRLIGSLKISERSVEKVNKQITTSAVATGSRA